MCKGEELEAWLAGQDLKKDSFEQIIYVGDGSNDFCPILRLRRYLIFLYSPCSSALIVCFDPCSYFYIRNYSQDTVLARNFGGLKDRIYKESVERGLKCQVRYWTGAWEVEEIFQAL